MARMAVVRTGLADRMLGLIEICAGGALIVWLK